MDIEARLARLEAQADRQDLQDCVSRFARGMDRFDRALFLSAFWPDATIAAGAYVGPPDALYDWARELHEQGQSATQHLLLNFNADVAGEEAHGESYYLFAGRNRDESNWLAGGRYLDRFERREGEAGQEWRIATRNTTVEWSGLLPSTPIPFSDVPDIFANGAPARNTSDPSYRRPLVNRRAPQCP